MRPQDAETTITQRKGKLQVANRAERRRTIKTTELREQAIEAVNQTPYLDVETDDGSVFRVWHPLLVDDDTQLRIELFNTGDDLDHDEDGKIIFPNRIDGKPAAPGTIRSAKAILGPAQHKAFVKAGGHSNDVQLAWNEMVRQHEEDADILGDSNLIEEEDPKADQPGDG
jgi:hypothetical protein